MKPPKNRLLDRALSLLAAAAVLATSACAAPGEARPGPADLDRFATLMTRKHGFQHDAVLHLLGKAEVRQDILDIIARPAEARPWCQYRPIFVTDRRAREGVEFWRRHEAVLHQAEAKFGVPAPIIVAIIGVETHYGRGTGRYRVLDALVTLGFHYPKRAEFFRSELEQYLLLTREEGLDPVALKGSYAGAMGIPQFISSSYRRYAVDLDGDGKRDLLDNPADAIGSVANYLKAHGWRPGQPVASPARIQGDGYKSLLGQGLEPKLSLAQLAGYGVYTKQPLAGDRRAVLLALQQEHGEEYWVGLDNFYVITRYNRSPLYAMAVYQLSERIAELHAKGGSTD